jgi:hypothetical protein
MRGILSPSKPGLDVPARLHGETRLTDRTPFYITMITGKMIFFADIAIFFIYHRASRM